MAGKSAPASRDVCFMRATVGTCSASPPWRRSWSTTWREVGARFTHHTSIAPTGTISLSLANNASNGIEPSFAHHYFRNVIREGGRRRRRWTCSRSSCWPTARSSTTSAMPNATDAAEKLPEYFTTADDVTPRAARGHPGRRADVGRFLHLQDRQRAHRLHVRGVQGHLPVRPREGAEGLHHLPLQPRGVPGRAGEGRGPEEHQVRVHAGGWHRGRSGRRRRDRIRRREALRRQSVRRAEGRLLRQVPDRHSSETH